MAAAQSPSQPSRISPRLLIQLLVFVFVLPLLPVLLSRRWGWWQAWLYAGICILGFILSRALLARRHPDLVSERARVNELQDAKPWDRRLAPLVSMGGGLIPLVAGVEARFDVLDDFSLLVELVALAAVLAGYLLGSWALLENRFFSGLVRIQTERGHQVGSSGPYRYVRHPGYAGSVLTYLATPFLLDAPWALLPAAGLAALLVLRTHLEDRTLQAELPGYCDYARRVRYRLLPGVW